MENEGTRFLLFDLEGESYAVEVERVEVVLESAPVTRVPKAPPHLLGVINYRGSVIPVADLRIRFGATPQRSLGVVNSVIVLHIRYAGDDHVIGMPADEVREVIDLDRSRMERAPTIGSRSKDGLIAGVCERDGRFIVVLDIDEAFSETALTRPDGRGQAEREGSRASEPRGSEPR
jgi:purine-binding chemotaxis protein CheW